MKKTFKNTSSECFERVFIFHRYTSQYSNHCNSGTSISSQWQYFCNFYYKLCMAVAQQSLAGAPINPNFGGPFNPVLKPPQPQINPTPPPAATDFKSFIPPPQSVSSSDGSQQVAPASAQAQAPPPIWPGLGNFGAKAPLLTRL